ncbi:tyrosine-type recombinase/integrase [Kordiimonas pumila]|uniref:Tyrosine-type recombinase/integrase n=1 Tax=Kordiimonas pumila TaxID=2161677 RepID=A0ABV7D3D1_9PROT|nr:site-specific integrase [Kordiimonas pumila]
MATYRKRSNKWRVEVRKKGQFVSASFNTKAEAVEWAIIKEAEIVAGKTSSMPKTKTVSDAFKRYGEEVSPTKLGGRWEQVLFRSMQRDPLTKVRLHELTTQHVADYRDRRLKKVSPATVNRNLNTISAVFTKARKEWGWLEKNPVSELDRPKQPRPRDRLIMQDEMERVTLALGYSSDGPIQNSTQLVGLFFLLAIETGMRLGELCRMDHTSVHLSKKYIQLHHTKNGDRRQVPLSSRAIELAQHFLETDQRVSSPTASALFRNAARQAEIKDLHFHDTRHEAITRLSKKLDVLALARMVGHRDIKNLMVYYNESATELAAMLE